MKEKSFELLKELLLLQSAGGYSMFDNSVDMAADIYCMATGMDREEFSKTLHDIGVTVWSDYEGDLASWKSRQNTYKTLIDTIFGGR